MKRFIDWLQDQFWKVLLIDQDDYRVVLFRFFRFISIPLLTGFAILELRIGEYVNLFFTLLTLSVFIILKALAQKTNRTIAVYRLGLGVLLLNICVGLYVSAAPIGSAFLIFWFPIPIFFLLGAYEGIFWNFGTFLVWVGVIAFSPYHDGIPTNVMILYSITYVVLSALSFVVEAVRDRVHCMFSEKQAELEKTNEEVYNSAIRDALTGFYNRTFLTDVFEATISQALRDDRPVVMILLDIDNFKTINDNFGHLAGDDALVIVSDAIRLKIKRKSDFVIRYGGDEFLIALFDISAKNAKLFATSIIEEVSKLTVPGCDCSVQISMGLVELDYLDAQKVDMTELVRQLISIADKNMYRAKTLGGSLVVDEIKFELKAV